VASERLRALAQLPGPPRGQPRELNLRVPAQISSERIDALVRRFAVEVLVVGLRIVADNAQRLALQRRRAKHIEAKASVESGRWAVFPGNSLLHFLDFVSYFFCPIGIELFFIAESPASALPAA
jgi:hypothetical protein